MCSPSGLIFALITSFALNCLHFNINNNNNDYNNRRSYFIVDASVTATPTTTSTPTIIATENAESNRNDHREHRSDSGRGGGLKRIVDITRKRKIHINGIEIDENSLQAHLTPHERELIFGKTNEKRKVKLVHLTHRPAGGDGCDAANKHEVKAGIDHRPRLLHHTVDDEEKEEKLEEHEEKASPADLRRVKRSSPPSVGGGPQRKRQRGWPSEHRSDRHRQREEDEEEEEEDNDHLLNLKLHQTPKLIDDAFVFINRYGNATQLIDEDSHELAQKYARCFYSNEYTALDLCDDANVRGVLHHNSTDYVIHPLPERFGSSVHVIVESHRDGQRQSLPVPSEYLHFEENIKFEPDEEDFNEPESVKRPRIHADDFAADQRQRMHHNRSTSRVLISSRAQHYPHANHHTPLLHESNRQHRQHQRKSPPIADKRRRSPSHRGRRRRRHVASGSGGQRKIPKELHIETAIFVDSDLFKHMAKNFPQNTKSQLIRFVLAMINGVQLLYHHSSLGHRINFVLKRLEILHEDPPNLQRSNDIDTYLSNFCIWQQTFNPPSDENVMHYDHAVILTGLDLYVLDKNGKEISQVVGLAPVSGMCTTTSSCTINEGKHFESVFVVAHEIGHNLGMRHDTIDNGCDPHLHIMSTTLGSGKTTWSSCSRYYLDEFLEKPEAYCLFDRGQFTNNLDHSAEGLLPGQRFDADQQCMLKYGKDSQRSTSQRSDICHDLHCKRDRYTWTSHPALEGTECGVNMWCRSGRCVARPALSSPYSAPKVPISGSVSKLPSYEKANFLVSHPLHEYSPGAIKTSSWSEWSEASECASSCLFGPSKRLSEGSTGLRTFSRRCLDYEKRCLGRDRKFEACIATKQCDSTVHTVTIGAFASQVCEKAARFEKELTGEGQQIEGDIEGSCKVYCKTKSNGTRSRNWIFPDGTTCRTTTYYPKDISYCIAGRCEKFSCDNSSLNYYRMEKNFCKYQQQPKDNSVEMEQPKPPNMNKPYSRYEEHDNAPSSNRNVMSMHPPPTTYRSKFENEVADRNFYGSSHEHPYKRKTPESYRWRSKYKNHLNDHQPVAASPPWPTKHASLVDMAPTEWKVISGCHSSCMAGSKGVQVVSSRRTGANNIQLCSTSIKPCDRLLTPSEFAENTCARYKMKVRGLSGHGTQIAASIVEPDRSCRVGCQDEHIKYRYYLVNGQYGQFPLGTKCSHTEERYCVEGKCLEFGPGNIPLEKSHISLALYRSKRSLTESEHEQSTENVQDQDDSGRGRRRQKRSFLYFDPVNITETITQDFLNRIVNSIIDFENKHFSDDLISEQHIEFSNPIHISTDQLMSSSSSSNRYHH